MNSSNSSSRPSIRCPARFNDDEVYVSDLVGCRVLTRDGSEVGIATEVQDFGGSPLLVVRRPQRPDALVPLVPEILLSVDLAGKVVQIDPPEGLLELDQPGDDTPGTTPTAVPEDEDGAGDESTEGDGAGKPADTPGSGGEGTGKPEDTPGNGGDGTGKPEGTPGNGGDGTGKPADTPGNGGDGTGKPDNTPGGNPNK